jgi:hypothetical protein
MRADYPPRATMDADRLRPIPRMLRLAVIVPGVIASLGGCDEPRREVTAPDERTVLPAAPVAANAPAESGAVRREALGNAVNDALTRVLAPFEGAPELTPLRLALAELRGVLVAPAAAPATVPDAAARAERLLGALERRYAGEPGTLAELGAVRLVIERVAELTP